MADITVNPQAIFDGDEALRVDLTKVNAVVRTRNEDQILPLAHICHDRGVPLRFIEYMDVGNTNVLKLDAVLVRTFDAAETEFGLLEPISPKERSEAAGATHFRRGMNLVHRIRNQSVLW